MSTRVDGSTKMLNKVAVTKSKTNHFTAFAFSDIQCWAQHNTFWLDWVGWGHSRQQRNCCCVFIKMASETWRCLMQTGCWLDRLESLSRCFLCHAHSQKLFFQLREVRNKNEALHDYLRIEKLTAGQFLCNMAENIKVWVSLPLMQHTK